MRCLIWLVLLLACCGEMAAMEWPLSGPSLAGGTLIIDPPGHRMPVLLVFWASWCPTCLREIPAINRFHADHASQVEVIACSIDSSPGEAQAAVNKRHIAYPVIADAQMAIADRFGVDATPMLILIGADGVELARGRSLGALREAWPRIGVTMP